MKLELSRERLKYNQFLFCLFRLPRTITSDIVDCYSLRIYAQFHQLCYKTIGSCFQLCTIELWSTLKHEPIVKFTNLGVDIQILFQLAFTVGYIVIIFYHMLHVHVFPLKLASFLRYYVCEKTHFFPRASSRNLLLNEKQKKPFVSLNDEVTIIH